MEAFINMADRMVGVMRLPFEGITAHIHIQPNIMDTLVLAEVLAGVGEWEEEGGRLNYSHCGSSLLFYNKVS